MQILLEKPELEKFIRDQVGGGQYSSPAAVVEAALLQWMIKEFPSDHLARLIDEGEASLVKEGPRSLDEVFDRLEKKSAAARSRASA